MHFAPTTLFASMITTLLFLILCLATATAGDITVLLYSDAPNPLALPGGYPAAVSRDTKLKEPWKIMDERDVANLKDQYKAEVEAALAKVEADAKKAEEEAVVAVATNLSAATVAELKAAGVEAVKLSGKDVTVEKIESEKAKP